MPGLLLNPVFLLLVLGALATAEILLENHIAARRHFEASANGQQPTPGVIPPALAGKIANRSGSAAIYNKV